MDRKRKKFKTLEEAQDFININNLKNCDIKEKKGEFYLIQKGKAIFGKYIYITNNPKKGLMMQDDEMTFDKMLGWVYRNCPGCDRIEVFPNKIIPEVVVYYQDRVEIYTLEYFDVLGNKEI